MPNVANCPGSPVVVGGLRVCLAFLMAGFCHEGEDGSDIKNARVAQLAAKLARLTRESITDAGGHAIEFRWAERQEQAGHEGLAFRLLEIGRHCARYAPVDWLHRDFDCDLYDDRGRPQWS